MFDECESVRYVTHTQQEQIQIPTEPFDMVGNSETICCIYVTTHSKNTSDSLLGNTNLGKTIAFLRLVFSVCDENWNSVDWTGECGLRIVIFLSLPPGLVSENTFEGGGRLRC